MGLGSEISAGEGHRAIHSSKRKKKEKKEKKRYDTFIC